MNEGIYTRDTGGPRKRIEPESTVKKKSHAGKLKNETSRAEAMRKKLRTGKADTAETAEEIKKSAKLKAQGRKAVRKNAAVSGEIRHQLNEANEDQNAGGDAINAGSQVAENGIYGIKKKIGKSADASGYSGKLHGRNATTFHLSQIVGGYNDLAFCGSAPIPGESRNKIVGFQCYIRSCTFCGSVKHGQCLLGKCWHAHYPHK